jgi:MoaA/NifB/PqqE/SkfB family radical SAM enzyme
MATARVGGPEAAPKAFDSACYAPFVALELDPRGRAYACCANLLYPIGKVTDSSLQEIWHGRRAQNLRQALRERDFSSGCNVCKWHVEHGKPDAVARTYDDLPVLSDLPPFPQRMTFALSNRCNLACVMCNGELSSRLRVAEGRPALPHVYGDSFFEELRTFLPHLRYAAFLGGEPFLSPENRRVWDELHALDHHIPLNVTTNGTIWNDLVEQTLERFPVSFNVSMDALDPELLASIRVGVDPGVLLTNARRFRDHAAARGTGFSFMFCLMSTTWQELPGMLHLADEWDVAIQVIHVSEPGMSLEELTTGQLEEVLTSWERTDTSEGSTFGRQESTWQTELRQLRATIEERRRGAEVTIRRAQPIAGAQLVPEAGAPRAAVAASHRDGVERIGRWAPDGTVVTIEADDDGRITAADLPAGRLADLLGDDWVGRRLDDVLERSKAGTGKDLWVIDRHAEVGSLDQTLILHEGAPWRGGTGEIVRVVSVAGRSGGDEATGTTSYLALDDFFAGAPA